LHVEFFMLFVIVWHVMNTGVSESAISWRENKLVFNEMMTRSALF
jgi:hypothetical protein